MSKPRRQGPGGTERAGKSDEPPVRDREDTQNIPDELPGYTPQAQTDNEQEDPDDLAHRAPAYTPDGELGT